MEKAVAARLRQEFGKWAMKVIEGGAKLAHRFTKVGFVRTIIETTWGTHVGEQVVPHPADAADAELDKWIPIWGWNKVDKTLEIFFENIVCPDLPPIKVEDFEIIEKLYSQWTTVGSDGIHPKHGKFLCKNGKKALVKCLNVSEKLKNGQGSSIF